MITKESYLKLTDEELVLKYHNGDDDAADYLVCKYKNLVRMHSRPYFLAGADNDDLIQEAMIGLYKAIRDYKRDKGVTFVAFAALCIDRQIITAVNSYNRQNNSPLNTYISLYTSVTDESGKDAMLSDVISCEEKLNPEAIFIAEEQTGQFLEKLKTNLSKLECRIFKLYIAGFSYAEIATELEITTKAVDNAIQRIRNKINLIRK